MNRPAPKPCWRSPRSWPRGRWSGCSTRSTSCCCRAPTRTAPRPTSASRPAASTPTATTCCCAPPRPRRWPSWRATSARSWWSTPTIHRGRPLPREIRRACSASTRWCNTPRWRTCRRSSRKAAEEWFRQPLLASLKAQGLTASGTTPPRPTRPTRRSRWAAPQPDTGRNVNGLRNAISLLIETRGVGLGRQHLARRVHTHVVAIRSVLNSAAQRAADLIRLRKFVDTEVASQACRGQAVIAAAATPSEYTLLMLDPATGADRPRQRGLGFGAGAGCAQGARAPLRLLARRRPDRRRAAPARPGRAGATARPRTASCAARRSARPCASRARRADVRGASRRGRQMMRVKVETVPALIDAPAGSYYVAWTSRSPTWCSPRWSPTRRTAMSPHRIIGAVDAASARAGAARLGAYAALIAEPGRRGKRLPLEGDANDADC